jgi:hypothetical protein
MSKTGRLLVKLKSDSVFFRHNVPIDVRNSNMRLVHRSRSTRQFDLPEGLYEVSAVLEDGSKHSQLVQVKAGEPTPVELGAKEVSQVTKTVVQARAKGLPAYERPRFNQKMDALTEDDTELYTRTNSQLLDVKGACLIREARTLWIFKAIPNLESVATALIRIKDHKTLISLPTSPEGGHTDNVCVVRVEEIQTGAYVRAWISRERSVANALQNMLASGYVLHAADVADQAVELLQYKYSDPTGAALGALILHKVGRLRRWTGWVKNLACDFEWMPDGKILWASLLREDESTRSKALELVLQACEQRLLYTESHSLLLDLLRRWPSNADHEVRFRAMNTLASQSPYIDLDSMCLSTLLGEE